MNNGFTRFLHSHITLIMLIVVLLILILCFHEIMTPFIIALIVVYLIEPMVTGMHKIHIGKHHLPRGIAVVCAYLVFLVAVTGIGFAFIPSLTSEISQATEQLPKYYTKVKDEEIPKLSHKFDEIVFKLSRKSTEDVHQSVSETSQKVSKSFAYAVESIEDLVQPTVDTSGNKPLLVAEERGEKASNHRKHNHKENKTPVLFTLHQTQKGDYEVRAGDNGIILEAGENGSYILKPKTEDSRKAAASSFNLEREINKTIAGFIESGTQYAGSALSFLQSAIELIVNAFIQFILVFILAAFISIDTPKLMQSIRSVFVPKDKKDTLYDEFKQRLTKGLAGVVRGQLIICCINGTLTGIGLAILGVDYALLLGIIAGIMSIVPIFGTIISTVPAVLLGLIQGPIKALMVLLVIIVVHLLDTNFFTPKIVGSSSNLHPVIIIFAILAGQMAAGVLGLILAVPMASIIQTTISFIIEQAKKAKERDEMLCEAPAAIAPTPASIMPVPSALYNAVPSQISPVVNPQQPVSAPSADIPAPELPKETPASSVKPAIETVPREAPSLLPLPQQQTADNKKPDIPIKPIHTPGSSADNHKVSPEKKSGTGTLSQRLNPDENDDLPIPRSGISPTAKFREDNKSLVKQPASGTQISLDELCTIEKFANHTDKSKDSDTLILGDQDEKTRHNAANLVADLSSGEVTGIRSRSAVIIHRAK